MTALAYNPAGRTNDSYAWTGSVAVSRDYATNGQNQYTGTVSDGVPSATFTHDANGNLTSDGTTTFAYDAENRLVSASGAKTASLVYDPLGRLFQVYSPATGVTQFLYDGDELVAEYIGWGNLARRYVHGDGSDDPLYWYEGPGLDQPRFPHTNNQGSVTAVAGTGAAALSINTYDEYGIPGASNQGRFQYTGQAWIPELGLYYYKARFYSPTLGRFLQTDPIGYDDQINLYAYVRNDPLNAVDSTGTKTECDKDGICTTTADGFNQSRSGGQNIALNEAQGQQAVADRRDFRTDGVDETIGFGFGTNSGETRTEVSKDATTTRGGTVYQGAQRINTADIGRASIPAGATWAQHGHHDGETMVDSLKGPGGMGDSQPLTQKLPNVVISEGRVGVRELVGGRLQHRMISGKLKLEEQKAIQQNLNAQQRFFYRNK